MMSTGQSRVTVKDVAKLAGVSTATVTRTFQNENQVVPETRQRVKAAVDALGYRPNPMARDLRHGGRSAAVGLAIASFTNEFQTGVAAGAERELRRAGIQLVIGSADLDPEHEPELARSMVDRRVSVLMMMPDGDARDYLSKDRLFGTPVVLIGRPADGLDADVVTTEDDRGVKEATDALLDLGHRRIAALAGASDSFRARQRLQGFRDALVRRGVQVAPELVVSDLLTSSDAYETVGRLLELLSPPTAIMALNLGISNGVLLDRITHQRRHAYIALDESELSIGLGISAIVRDPEELGRRAALLAIARIDQPDRPATTVVLPSRLIKRGSGEIAAGDLRQ
jgi:LacI family transcriptional regulator